jgi:predicted PurR-regulated permease PerM
MGIGLNTLEDKTFLLLIISISLAFAWILWPFYGAVLWGTVLAIVFAPLYRRLSRSMRQRRNLAALATVVIIVVIVILPSALITASLVQEASGLYGKFQSGELNLAGNFQQVVDALPTWVASLLDRFGLTNLAEVQERLSAALVKGSQFLATQALNIGQITLELIVRLFVMLYLLFFLLRDGDDLFRTIKDAIPLRAGQQRAVFSKFATVIRATVKGTIAVAVLQGALGGLIFWFLGIRAELLWAVLMAFLSLLPAVGAALVWLPVARNKQGLPARSRPSPPSRSCPAHPQRKRSRVPKRRRFRHSVPRLSSISDAWGRLNVVTPFHHLSGDSHLHRSLGAGPITASS